MPDIVNRPLGSLEQAVMDVLWRRSPASVHDVAKELVDRALAYTTLMTTLDRLHRKGLVSRAKRGHAYHYRPAISRADFERQLVSAMLGGIPAASRETLLAGFLDFACDDVGALDALERLIAERRQP